MRDSQQTSPDKNGLTLTIEKDYTIETESVNEMCQIGAVLSKKKVSCACVLRD